MRAHPLKIFAASYTYLNDGKMEFDHKSNEVEIKSNDDDINDASADCTWEKNTLRWVRLCDCLR